MSQGAKPTNHSRYSDKGFMKDIATFLASKCPEDLKDKVKEVVSGARAAKTGLVLSERLLNVPEQIAPPLLQFMEEARTLLRLLVRRGADRSRPHCSYHVGLRGPSPDIAIFPLLAHRS